MFFNMKDRNKIILTLITCAFLINWLIAEIYGPIFSDTEVLAVFLVFILYFLYSRKSHAEPTQNSRLPSYFFFRVMMGFFSLLSIVFVIIAVVSGPEGGTIAGLGMLVFGAIAVLAFLIALPMMVFFRIKHCVLSKLTNTSIRMLIIINVLALGFMFLMALIL